VITSNVNYLSDMDVRPVFYAQNVERNNLQLESHAINIQDARQLPQAPTLEKQGFTLVPHATQVADFTDHTVSLQQYQQEIEALVLELTGADKVIVGNSVLRWSERAGDTSAFVNSHPARFVHVDYSRKSFEDFARMHLADDDDAKARLAGRFVAYNVWRVINPPPHDVPLAICDATTASPDHVTTGDAVIDPPDAPDVRFESSLYQYRPTHRWFYYPDMQLDEALVFKAFDTDLDRVQGCPHSAFNDPNCPEDALPRASVEIRAYAFY